MRSTPGLPNTSNFGRMPRPGEIDALMRPFTRRGARRRHFHSHVTVEVSGSENSVGVLCWVCNGGGQRCHHPDPQSHRDAHADTQVASLFDFCQAAELADLEINDVHCEVGFARSKC